MLSYSPFEVYRCCQHNVSHGWPYYAEELWLATADNGLCALLYAASEVRAKVADGTTVKIAEATDYPFEDTIRLTVSLPNAVRFPLYLRVPRWSGKPLLTINGKPTDARAVPLSYLVVERTWSDGDTVSLQLPMHTSLRVWKKNKDSVSVDYGPLTFSLKIGERRQALRQQPRLAGMGSVSHDALELRACARRPGPGQEFRAGASPRTAAAAALHARHRAAHAASEGQADPRVAARQAGAGWVAPAQPGQVE